MRRAINENPVVQVVLLGALGIIVAFLFMTRVMGQNDTGGAPASTTPAPTAAGTAPAPAAPTPAASPTAPATAAPTDPAAAAAPTGVGFEAGAGLPKDVVAAHDAGDVVVLLVVNRKATEDRRLEAEVKALRGRGDASIFVTEAKDVARYSRIAEGVNLDRVPGLVVLEPKSQVEGDLPGATISYGYRGPESVQQAVEDVLYDGKELPYHPG